MSEMLDAIVKRHDQLCEVSLDPTGNEVCNCGADVAASELAQMRERDKLKDEALEAARLFLGRPQGKAARDVVIALIDKVLPHA